MAIDLRQLNTGELSDFIEVVSTDTIISNFTILANSGLYLGNNIVYASGLDQTISGQKTFINSPYVPYVGLSGQAPSKQYIDDQIDTINLEGIINMSGGSASQFFYVPTPVYGSGAINLDYLNTVGMPLNLRGPFDTGAIYNKFDSVFFDNSSYIYTGVNPFTGSTNDPTGDALWYLLAVGQSGIQGPPGTAFQFVNNGTLTGSFLDLSFYVDVPYTGLNLMESFVSHSGMFSGYALGCFESGRGPIHRTSGISGALLINQLSGDIYVRDADNNKTIVQGFSLDSGEIFKTGNIVSTFNSLSRIGIDLYSGLSGMRGLTIGVFGLEVGV